MEQLIRSLRKVCTLGIYEAKVNVFLLSNYFVLLVTAFCRSYLQSLIIPNQGGLIFFFFCSPLKPWLSIQEKLGSTLARTDNMCIQNVY